jgi:hypothetical protein
MQQMHMHFFQSPATFAMVATWAGRDHVGPNMLTTQMLGQDVIDCQGSIAAATVLTGIIVASKNFASSQFHAWSWPVDHVL